MSLSVLESTLDWVSLQHNSLGLVDTGSEGFKSLDELTETIYCPKKW